VEDAVAASPKSSTRSSAADSRVLAKLAGLKRTAARTCLGSNTALSPAPQHVGQQPISVAPVPVPQRPSGTRLPAHTSSPPPQVSVRPLISITSCDALGCWASDGSHLQRVGPNLLGPKGFCSAQVSVLNCP
jgi:hypothetical protein